MLFKALLVISLVMFLTACDGEKAKEIKWQLPLSVPEDPHASSKGNELPDWAKSSQGSARIVFLEKSTTRIFAVDVEIGSEEIGSEEILEDWVVQLQGLATGLRIKDHSFINDEQVDNPAGFVTVSYRDTLIYEGWLYQNFPELFGMDNSDWKVWIENVNMPPSLQEDETLLP